MKYFDRLIEFLKLLNKFRLVYRVQTATGSDRLENDVEHSYDLAMYAWYVKNLYNLDLDMYKVFMYCLAHDLVEVYAGDAYFLINEKQQDEKLLKEKESFERISKGFLDFPELIQTIEDYEKRSDPESRFVYTLDKTIDPIQYYIEGGTLLKEKKLGFLEAAEIKDRKINGEFPASDICNEFKRKVQEEGVLKFFYKE